MTDARHQFDHDLTAIRPPGGFDLIMADPPVAVHDAQREGHHGQGRGRAVRLGNRDRQV